MVAPLQRFRCEFPTHWNRELFRRISESWRENRKFYPAETENHRRMRFLRTKSPLDDVRCYPESGHRSRASACPLCANSGHGAVHSITSSARAKSLLGISNLSAFAVLRLITNSNLADCTTGKSPGFSPFRI